MTILVTVPPAHKQKLLDRVRAILRVHHYSRRTEEAYIDWIRRFILYHQKRHPDGMGEREVAAFLTYLAAERNVSASTQNQALSALLFLYGKVLERELGRLDEIAPARRPQRLPVVLTMEETRRLLVQMKGECRLVAALLYGCGLRLLECVRLRVHPMRQQLSYRK